MTYTTQQLIDMSLTVYDLRTAMQKFYAEYQGLDTNPSGGGTDITSTDELAEGTKNLYFTPQRVRNTAMQGITLTDATTVTASDTVLTSIGKLQAQASSYGDAVTYNIGTSGAAIPLLNTANTWSMPQTFSGGLAGSLTGSLIGNASTASELQTTRNINLNGSVKGSVQFDGSQDVLIDTSFSKFDSAYATSIGGYPLGAILLLNDGVTDVVSTVANNLTDPNVSMTGWVYKSQTLVTNDYTTLAALSAKDGVIAFVKKDGIAGEFRYDSASTATPNGGTIIASSKGGNWVRILNGYVTPEMFECVKNSKATSARLSAVLQYAFSNNIELKVSDGTWYSDITNLTGSYKSLKISQMNGGNPIIYANITNNATTLAANTPFVSVSGAIVGSEVQATADVLVNESRLSLPSSFVSTLSEGMLLYVGSTRMIPTAGQKLGFMTKLKRIVDSTTVEIDFCSPFYMPATNLDCVLTSYDETAKTITSSSLVGVSATVGRRVVQIGSLKYTPTAFDSTTGTLTFDTLPSGVSIVTSFSMLGVIYVQAWNPCFVDIDGVSFKKDINTTATGGNNEYQGLYIQFSDTPDVRNLTIEGFAAAGCYFSKCYHPTIKDYKAMYCNKAFNGYDGHGYGASFDCCHAGLAENVTAYSCRRAVDFGGNVICSTFGRAVNVRAYGGGTAYDGNRFFPLGSAECSTVGSHEAAFFTEYTDSFGHNVNTVMNMRGLLEVIRNTHGTGDMDQVINIFIGSPPVIDGVYYEGGKALVNSGVLNDPLDKMGSVDAVVQVYGDAFFGKTRELSVSNVVANGVDLAILKLSNGCQTSDIYLKNIDIVTGTSTASNDFYIIRNSGSGTSRVSGIVYERNINIHQNNTGRVIPAIESINRTTPSVYVDTADGYNFIMTDDTVIEIPLKSSANLVCLDLFSTTANRNFAASGVLLQYTTGRFLGAISPAIGSAYNVTFSGTVTDVASATDGQVTVTYAAGSQGGKSIYVINRFGSTWNGCLSVNSK